MASNTEKEIDSATGDNTSSSVTETSRPKPIRPPPPNRIVDTPTEPTQEQSFLPSDLSESPTSPSDPIQPQPPPYAPPSSLYTPPPIPTPATTFIPHEVQPLTHAEVRWFYREPNVYWKPFCGHDSLRLEQQYQLLTTEGDSGDPNNWVVRVHGEMYDVNLQEMTCEAVFWKSTVQKILRGTWFEITSEKKWYPLEKDDAASIELAHCDRSWRLRADNALKSLSEAGQTASGKMEWNKVILKNHNVVWYGDKEIFMIKTDFSSRMIQKIGFSSGNKLVRGYKDPATFEDGRLPPVRHVVFCTHGIGQAYNMSDDIKFIVKSTSDLRNMCSDIAKKHFKDQWESGRVEFIPVEWRSMLTLDRGIVETITPQDVKQLRDIANSTILDVIYYLSPVFQPEIIESVRFQLNKYFLHVLERFPDFMANGGRFSMFAHSLGSVIVFDILSECKGDLEPPGAEVVDESQEKQSLEVQLASARARVSELENRLAAMGKSPKLYKKKIGLKFPVEHLFAVGSPLGVFLAMRDAEKHISHHHMSAEGLLPFSVCKRIHNIYHPSDCVAYRLEPLLSAVYTQVKPVRMDSSGSGVSQNMVDHASGPRIQENTSTKKGGFFSSMFGSRNASLVAKEPPPDKILDDDSSIPAESRLKERLDFRLKEGRVESAYVNSLFAHTGYWTNTDVALFLLCQIYTYKI